MPTRTDLNPVIHGKVQRDGFSVERVYFESMPNHFVTGLLFRPDDGRQGIKRPGVLCPHGHGGRLQDYGEKKTKQLIVDGAERFEKSGEYLQRLAATFGDASRSTRMNPMTWQQSRDVKTVSRFSQNAIGAYIFYLQINGALTLELVSFFRKYRSNYSELFDT